MSTYLDRSLVKLEEFEGSIPWMYRDTVGKVTVGVGTMLPDEHAASLLHFQVGGRPAAIAEITTEFSRVYALPMGRAAAFYRGSLKPELPQSEITALLRTVLVGFESDLRRHLPTYDEMPDSVKMALLDMAYNLGPSGLLNGYPRLVKAVAAGAWAQAADACQRHGPGPERNDWTRKMFLAGVVGTIKAEVETLWQLAGFALLGAGMTFCVWATKKLCDRTPRGHVGSQT